MKKPMLKPYTETRCVRFERHGTWHNVKVRVSDARELTPEKAVEKSLQFVWDIGKNWSMIKGAAYDAGMTATEKNGKVRVRLIK